MAKRKNPHAVALGRRGGRVVTPKKLAHLRKVATLGGRKPKFGIGDQVRVGNQGPSAVRGQLGVIRGHLERARYKVAFADETRVLYSWWLEPVG